MTVDDPIKPDRIAWCLHCERAYQKGEHRKLSGLSMCPYEDCDGDTVIDQWTWSRIREENPGYPEIPERGTVYALYGPDYVHPSKRKRERRKPDLRS